MYTALAVMEMDAEKGVSLTTPTLLKLMAAHHLEPNGSTSSRKPRT